MITTINPYTGKELARYEELSQNEIKERLKLGNETFLKWRKSSFELRSSHMYRLSELLKERKEEYGKVISEEMGKPITQAAAEVEKCAWVCEYYAEHAVSFLQDEAIKTDANHSYIRFDPLGLILAVMPWNYPFWQVFRFVAPALMAGNTGVLKHASSVMHSANLIEEVILDAGFPVGCFQNLVIGSDKVESILRNPLVKAVTLTGSEGAGKAVSSTAASEIKKSVLELGGSNAFIVLDDADIDTSVALAVNARYQNTGQSCIAAKRLLLQEGIATKFLKKFIKAVEHLKVGDPADKETYIGVLAREDLAKTMEEQLQRSIEMGAEILTGGKRDGAFFAPTVVDNVTVDMPVFREETFGPLLTVNRFKDIQEAIDLSNDSAFGLGVTICTGNISTIENYVSDFNEGAVFINDLVKSDPRLPFGGVKRSGFGRELSQLGIREFVNAKTVYIKR
ncbi:NAD-dependent succinate-semialdehyde dehydrogenase [Robertkochia solimangrovi]|uniref:NAD-dependent succinate-semialdehyde dehydrogenase n=1 Tax=Robertkochia solimangrovi TaxID=2213046 RepID=UPI0011815EA5|nr:NAD-dependent succinate-semialdehyde dehydrogenase [Robertkochia solimangrovi]TRZ45250.1 NAD-dependent succinate-semialdehyde dehydrogenase [Robertkochia solimangrovi]